MPQTAEDQKRDDAAKDQRPIDGQPSEASDTYNDESGRSNNDKDVAAKSKPTFSERCQGLWTKTKITRPKFKLMFKGALAPTIAVALFQADDFASHFSTVGYLIGIET